MSAFSRSVVSCIMLHKATHLERKTVAKLNEYLTVAEAAAYIGCSSDTLRRWDRANKLPARRHPVTGYRLYLPRELDEFLREVGGVNKKAAARAKSGHKPPKARARKRRS